MLRANWIKTILFNFRVLPFKYAKHLPFLLYGDVVITGSDKPTIVFNGCKPYLGMITIGNSYCAVNGYNVSPNVTILSIKGKLIVHGLSFIGNGSCVSILKGATLELGKKVFLNNDLKLLCKDYIYIGDYSRSSWQCQIMDTSGHYFVTDENMVKRNTGKIYIGSNCWIGNRVSIMQNSYLPDFSIVSSNSMVNKDFRGQPYGIYAGTPAKLIKSGCRRIVNFDLEDRLNVYFANNPNEQTYLFKDMSDMENIFTYSSKLEKSHGR